MERHASALDADLDAFAAERIHQRGLRTPEQIAGNGPKPLLTIEHLYRGTLPHILESVVR